MFDEFGVMISGWVSPWVFHGFGFGAYRRFKYSRKTNLLLGLSFDYQRYGYDYSAGKPFEEEDVIHQYYLTVPLLLRFNFGKKKWRPFFEIGPGLDLIKYGYNNSSTKYLMYNQGPIPGLAAQLGFGLTFPLFDSTRGFIKFDSKVAFDFSYTPFGLDNGYLRLSIGITH